MNIGSFSTIDIVFFSVFSLSFLIQLYYYLFIFRHLAFCQPKLRSQHYPPVSIIICARSEEKKLSEYLPSVLSQEYPEYQVVVVDDCSYDGTSELLKQFAGKFKHLKVVTIQEDEHYSHGKKLAQLIGIKGANFEHLLFTDADCVPASKSWLKLMMSSFENPETEIVLGYGAYKKESSWLNKLIRFDTFFIAVQYFSFALVKLPYMGVGRNLAYRKSLFYKHRGFASHYHLESGDDDLFVSEAATKINCEIEINPGSVTMSKPKATFFEWVMQKRRHITTGAYYKPKIKFFLGILTISPYLFFVGLFALLIMQTKFLFIVIAILLVRYLVQMIIFSKTMKKLGESDLLFYSLVLELQLLLFYPIFLFANTFSRKKSTWKN